MKVSVSRGAVALGTIFQRRPQRLGGLFYYAPAGHYYYDARYNFSTAWRHRAI